LKLGQETYEDCSFSSKGIGTYMGNENSDPQLGARFEFVETEIKIEVTFEKHLESKILKALLAIMFMKRWPTKFMNYKTRIKM
jgi:hypothetical protein